MTLRQKLLERIRHEGTPLVDENLVTFVWLGDSAPMVVGDFNDWGRPEALSLHKVGEGVWSASISLPDDAYIEYFYTFDPEDEEVRLPDPHNRRVVSNGLGGYQNYLRMPLNYPTGLRQWRRGIRRGRVSHHVIRNAFQLPGGKRDVWLYQPATGGRVPLLLVYDGRDYKERARIVQIVDNMIDSRQITPIAMVMVDNGRDSRFVEYHSSEAALMMFTYELLPLVQRHLSVMDPAESEGAYGVLGASMGGLMALYTGLRMPHIFGKVASQSGAYLFDMPPIEMLIKTLVRLLPTAPLKIWQDVGTFEQLLQSNREMNELLIEHGYDVTYYEYHGGHNYTSWRDNLPMALTTLFPYGK